MNETTLPKAKNLIFMIGDGMGIGHRTAAGSSSTASARARRWRRWRWTRFPSPDSCKPPRSTRSSPTRLPAPRVTRRATRTTTTRKASFPTTPWMPSTIRASNTWASISPARRANRSASSPRPMCSTPRPARGRPHAEPQQRDRHLRPVSRRGHGQGELVVLLGGGRKWFLPATTPGSARTNATDYQLPAELAAGGACRAVRSIPARDLLGDFQRAGFTYTANATQLKAIPADHREAARTLHALQYEHGLRPDRRPPRRSTGSSMITVSRISRCSTRCSPRRCGADQESRGFHSHDRGRVDRQAGARDGHRALDARNDRVRPRGRCREAVCRRQLPIRS